MHVALFGVQQLAVASALLVCTAFCSVPVLAAMGTDALPTSVITLAESLPDSRNKTLELAHNGDGCEAAGGAIGSTITSAQMMTLNGHASHVAASDSLWGNLLLSMAYQRDPEIQKYARKLTRVNRATMLSIIGVSGLGIAQSIVGLGNIRGADTIEVGHDHHDDEPHLHSQADSKAPAVMGIVGSGATLATIGFQTLMNRHYSHKISDRQAAIKGRVEHILGHLKAGEVFASVEADLVSLIGETATAEFAQIWRAVNPPE